VADLTALIVDYGGVLTAPLGDTMSAWFAADNLDPEVFRAAMRDWLGLSAPAGGSSLEAVVSPIHSLERGEIDPPEFERQLAARLRTVDGGPVEPVGLLQRMFTGYGGVSEPPPLIDAVRRVKAAGHATALLSNSWGMDYPRDGWSDLFDVVVISGEVGMRKPEPEIYQLTVDQLGVPAQQCAFVDDLRPNVRAAAELGMVGIHHTSDAVTLAELAGLFGVTFTG
jgi:putative hydrolase of the HAD superfamily